MTDKKDGRLLAWTPFSCLPTAPLTISGLLQLDSSDHEVELSRNGPCELRWEGAQYDGQPMTSDRPVDAHGPWQSRHSNLTVTLTTHRLVFVWTSPTAATTTTTIYARFLHLSNVHSIQSKGGPSLLHPNASYKVVLSTYTFGDFILSWSNGGVGGGVGAGLGSSGLGSPHQQRDALVTLMETTLTRKAWEVATRFQQEQIARQGLTSRKVGVDHILTKHKLKHRQAAQVAQEALSGDAEQLLHQASALLQVIQSYTTILNNHQNQQQQQQQQDDKKSSNGDEPDEDVERLSSLLQDMGMTSGLTKDHFGGGGGTSKRRGNRNRSKNDSNNDYYEWLARQVVDFLVPRLPAMGGVISLTDVYCLFNRARGTNLISPEDLRTACDLLQPSTSGDNGGQNGGGGGLRLPISQKTFSTGIVVLQLEDSIPSSTTLIQLCPTTALQASHVLKVSPLLALEQLQDAEQAGWLCRDTTLETIVFYPNRFSEWMQMAS